MVTRLCLVLTLAASLLAAQKVRLKPDSPEEKTLMFALTETDLAKRIALLNTFVTQYPESASVGLTQLLIAYVETKEWDKAIEIGKKAYEADKDEPLIPTNLLKAAQGKGDNNAVVEYGTLAGASLAKAMTTKPPEMADDDWQKHKDFMTAQRTQLEYECFNAAIKDANPASRAAALEKIVTAFAGGNYAKLAPPAIAMAYQQANDIPKMTAAAQKALEADPQNESMNLILGETFLQQKRFDQAVQNARNVLKIFETKPKPDGMSDADWPNYQKNFNGAAHSIIGRTLMQQEKTAAAIPELKSAVDLLGANPQAMAPALYNLAFAYAKEKRYADAKPVLARAVQIPGPFQQLSKDLSTKVNAAK